MAKILTPRIETFFAEGAISKGHVVIIGSTSEHVAQATSSTDALIGIATRDAANGEYVEVAGMCAGAKGKAGGAISAGNLLSCNALGKLVVAEGGDRILGVAMEDAVENDLFAMVIVPSEKPSEPTGSLLKVANSTFVTANLPSGDGSLANAPTGLVLPEGAIVKRVLYGILEDAYDLLGLSNDGPENVEFKLGSTVFASSLAWAYWTDSGLATTQPLSNTDGSLNDTRAGGEILANFAAGGGSSFFDDNLDGNPITWQIWVEYYIEGEEIIDRVLTGATGPAGADGAPGADSAGAAETEELDINLYSANTDGLLKATVKALVSKTGNVVTIGVRAPSSGSPYPMIGDYFTSWASADVPSQTVIPADFRPAHTVLIPITHVDDGDFIVAMMAVYDNGLFEIFPTGTGAYAGDLNFTTDLAWFGTYLTDALV